MKKKIISSLLMVTLLTMVLGLSGCTKTTGGGSFYDEAGSDGDFYTFGFNAQPVGEPYGDPIITLEVGEEDLNIYQQDAKGQLTIVNHTQGFKIKVNFEGTLGFVDDLPGEIPETAFFGQAMVKTQGMENELIGPYSVLAMFLDSDDESDPDQVYLLIGEGDIIAFLSTYPQLTQDFVPVFIAGGYLEPGSDIVIH